MKASWFKKQGYKKVDRAGMSILLWKPFTADVKPPHWIKSKQVPALVPGKVVVTAIKNGWCSSGNITYERAKAAALELGDKVVWQEIDTTNQELQQKWGFGDRIFIQDKCITTGPPLSYEKIKKLQDKAIKKIN